MALILTYGLIGILLWNFGNLHKKHLAIISLFVAGLFITNSVDFYFGARPAEIVWAASAVGLIIAYSFRYASKSEKGVLDYLKIFGLLLLIVYPYSFRSLFRISSNHFWTVTGQLTFVIVFTIFVYDRYVLKPNGMKKKFLIALVVQSLLILLMLTFSLYQKAEADRSRELARNEHMRALELQERVRALEVKYEKSVN